MILPGVLWDWVKGRRSGLREDAGVTGEDIAEYRANSNK